MEKGFILGIDQGSTGTKAIVVDHEGEVRAGAYRGIGSFFPHDGWLEHNPAEIWQSVVECVKELAVTFDFRSLCAVGITNQRETSIIWEKSTGKPLTAAISWQCTRSAAIIERWRHFHEEILEKTGLAANAYYSASKIAWILENDPSLRSRAEQGGLLFGTVNTWIIWNLNGGRLHVTDSTNAGRTMFFDVQKDQWDTALLEKMNIPAQLLPSVLSCDGYFGDAVVPAEVFVKPVPICGSIGDQQSALFGQVCTERGEAKCTIGTSINLVVQTKQYEKPSGGVPPSIASNISGTLNYDLEGGVYVAGSVNEWLIEQMGMASNPQEISAMAQTVENTNGAYVVPAFQGLGAPHWDMNARCLITGLSRYHTKHHICKAALESLALQTNDVVIELQNAFNVTISLLRVDGGVAKDDFILQSFADILRCRIERPQNTDRTPMGAVYIAGLAQGLWKNTGELKQLWKLDKAFEPQMKQSQRDDLVAGWKEAVKRSLGWTSQDWYIRSQSR
ncbi:MAG: glycerol kinase GlpK [Treponema sp.]|jgi:glycerol kinase|nr:glycerol kinase GlpK [Treponema sp.]